MMLTKEQNHAVRSLLKNRCRDQIQTLGGLAGTGKSTLVGVLSAALPNFAVCAFTGKAASVLAARGTKAVTIHSLIYTPVPVDKGVEFRLKPRYEVGCQGFLVDEASMVSKDLYNDLISFGLPLIFVGDHGQLEPIKGDVHLMAEPTYRLETIHRNAGEIAHFAEHLRKGKPARSFEGNGRVSVLTPNDVSDELLLHAGQIITAFNKDRVGINHSIRELRGRTKLVEPKDRIICLRNNRQAGLFNGLQGRVTRVCADRLDFLADNGVQYRDVSYDPDAFNCERPEFNYDSDKHPFDYAYCITCHKAQGSEWNAVLVVEKHCPRWEPRRWNYTVASRAKRRLTWVTQR
jgi:exodeoxyribonuclease-5